MPFLKKVSGEPAGQCIPLDRDVIVIGRSPEADILLNPHGVSRKHAQIHREGENYYILDLRSRNKTKINEVEMAPGQDHLLCPGDRINICDEEFIFHLKPPDGPGRDRPTNELVVTDNDDESTIHMLNASGADMLIGTVRPEAKLRGILEISRNLSSALKIDVVGPKILDSLFELFPQAERVFLVLRDPETKRLVRKAFKHRPTRSSGGSGRATTSDTSYKDEAPLSISRSIVNHVLEQKKAVISQDAGNDPNLKVTGASIVDLKIRSVMCAPLVTPDEQALGILQLDASERKQFQQDDLALLVAVASQAAIAIQNASMHESLLARERLDRDLRLAEQVQKRFLPQSVPKIPGYQFFAHYNAAYEVGGDYYDFVPLPGNRLAVAVGDVSGKGVAAALMMAKFSGDTRYCILTETAPAPAADQLNTMLCAAGIEEKFITLSLSVLDPVNHKLSFCSAGHFPLMIRRANGTIEEIGAEIAGFPLGIMDDSVYQQATVTLHPGDVVVVYSDGVTDARGANEELYDSVANHRLIKRVTESVGGPEAMGRAILQEIREFSVGQRQADDITLVCFGRVTEK